MAIPYRIDMHRVGNVGEVWYWDVTYHDNKLNRGGEVSSVWQAMSNVERTLEEHDKKP